jgi:hypothetical protein
MKIFIETSSLFKLGSSKLKDFEVFFEKYSDNIVEKWINYFVFHKNTQFKKINTRIK